MYIVYVRRINQFGKFRDKLYVVEIYSPHVNRSENMIL